MNEPNLLDFLISTGISNTSPVVLLVFTKNISCSSDTANGENFLISVLGAMSAKPLNASAATLISMSKSFLLSKAFIVDSSSFLGLYFFLRHTKVVELAFISKSYLAGGLIWIGEPSAEAVLCLVDNIPCVTF